MKFLINRNTLLLYLNIVEKAIDSKHPQYSMIKIMAKENLELSTTNINTFIKVNVGATGKIMEAGEALVNGKLFISLVRKLDDKEIIFTTDGNLMKINCGKSSYKLNLMGDLFPEAKEQDWDDSLTIPAEDLKSMIKKVVVATSTNSDKPLMMGINFKIQGNCLYLTGLDGYRIARDKFILQTQPFNLDIVIPGEPLIELSRILNSGPLTMHINNNYILFNYGPTNYMVKKLIGAFPETDSFFEVKDIITINKNNLINATERASIFIDPDSYFKMEIVDKKMIITTIPSQTGQAYEVIDIDNLDGKNITLGMSHKALLEALKSFDSTNIVISTKEAFSVVLFMGNDEKLSETLNHIIMPVRYREDDFK